jgi:signal transduction histidine kinase
MEEGGGGTLKIVAEATSELVRITIEDNGPGMSQEVLKRIFDPFFTTKPIGKGTGLGLSISYSIVKQHGGKIFAHSAPGVGSSFTIEIPKSTEADSNRQSEAS